MPTALYSGAGRFDASDCGRDVAARRLSAERTATGSNTRQFSRNGPQSNRRARRAGYPRPATWPWDADRSAYQRPLPVSFLPLYSPRWPAGAIDGSVVDAEDAEPEQRRPAAAFIKQE